VDIALHLVSDCDLAKVAGCEAGRIRALVATTNRSVQCCLQPRLRAVKGLSFNSQGLWFSILKICLRPAEPCVNLLISDACSGQEGLQEPARGGMEGSKYGRGADCGGGQPDFNFAVPRRTQPLNAETLPVTIRDPYPYRGKVETSCRVSSLPNTRNRRCLQTLLRERA